MSKKLSRAAVGLATTAVGLLTAATPTWASTNGVSATATVGLGSTAALHGVWSLIGPGPKEHWHLTFPALALAASPWVSGFAGAAAACVAWIAGIVLFLLTDAAYAADQASGAAPHRCACKRTGLTGDAAQTKPLGSQGHVPSELSRCITGM